MRRLKQTVLILVFVLSAPLVVESQTAIDQLSADLQFLFDELGKELVPNFQTASVLNHGLGSAQLGDFPRMYYSLSVGGTLDTRGVLHFTKEEFADSYENYELFRNLFDEIGLNDDDTRDITDNYLPIPSIRAGIGVGLVEDWELSVQAGVVPQAATATALGFAGDEDGTLEDVRASITTVGTRLRRVLVRQDKGVPAVSAGVGYVYSALDFSFPLGAVDPLDFGGSDGARIALDGDIVFKTVTHSVGFDARLSQQVLKVFYPFVGVSSYFQFSNYEAGAKDFGGEILADADATSGTSVVPAVEPFSEQEFRNFNVVINTGFDLKLWVFNLFLHGNYALSTQAPGGIVGVRLQF